MCVHTHVIYGRNDLSIMQKEHMNKAKVASEALLFVKRDPRSKPGEPAHSDRRFTWFLV